MDDIRFLSPSSRSDCETFLLTLCVKHLHNRVGAIYIRQNALFIVLKQYFIYYTYKLKTFIITHCLSGSLRPEDDDFDMEEELQKLHPPPRQELEAGSRWGFVGDPMVIFEDSDSEQEEDNDSDGPILYRDDADEDDEEDVPLSMML